MEQPDISNASSDLTEEEKDLENTGSDFLVSKQLLGDLDFENGFGSKDVTSRCYKPVEELWLVESSDIFHVDRQAHYSISLTGEDNISDDLILNTIDFQYDTVSFLSNGRLRLEREYPVEEPCLYIDTSVQDVEPEDKGPQITEILPLDKPSMRLSGNEKENHRLLVELEEIPKNCFLMIRMTSATLLAFTGFVYIPFWVQHRNMADGQRASMSTGAEGRVHGGSLITLLVAGSGSNDGSSNRGNVAAMPP
ncbi:Nucleic acid-binding, OB-fold [Artemisia annua]|uniref:Nucleic acid-binding, OB-fold n=1 Tax=Artemisia annua TaxID=35608 RepID=A0A2U1M4F4_ARTAN|nr:Nucleic acid-binding, OB-fold [Artemisia annua]